MISTQLLGEAWETFVDFLLPRLCCGCGDRVHQSKWLVCEECLDSIPDMRLPICAVCGCSDAVAKDEKRCKNCPSGKIWFTRARGVYDYKDLPHLLVEKLKYKGRVEYAALMALAMAKLAADDASPPPDLVVPVPLHSARRRERGFNQSLLLAKEFALLRKLPIEANVLRRDKPTPSQTRLKRRERRANVAGAFSCSNRDQVTGKAILLIDDVYTTGSTLNECARVLIESGATSIECLAYTRAPLS